MRLEVEIHTKGQVISAGCEVVVAGEADTWKECCLGQKAKDRGVYVIHHGKNIVYVGKANGPTISFGMRLRHEFQATASGGRHIYPMLSSIVVPPPIMVSLFPAELRMLAHTIYWTRLNESIFTPIFNTGFPVTGSMKLAD